MGKWSLNDLIQDQLVMFHPQRQEKPTLRPGSKMCATHVLVYHESLEIVPRCISNWRDSTPVEDSAF